MSRELKILIIPPIKYKFGISEKNKTLMKERDKVRIASQHDQSNDDRKSVYKKLRNKCNAVVRRDTRKHAESLLLNNIDDNVKLWDLVSHLQGNKSHRDEDIVICDGSNELSDPAEVAEAFNLFFIDKIEKIKESIEPSLVSDPTEKLRKHLEDWFLHTFVLQEVNEGTVMKHVGRLKRKGAGPDGIPPGALRDGISALITPLTCLINRTFREAKFPCSWKEGKIIPVFKKGDRKLMSNYRPISILPSLSKIVESIVKDQIMNHMEYVGLIPPEQHGYRQNRSTSTAIMELLHHWGEAKNKRMTTSVTSYDLSAAFDCMSPEFLVKKLKLYNFDDTACSWIMSFLSDRRQRVQIKSVSSSSKCLTLGSPQGSVLSPILFLIYMADTGLWLKECQAGYYADDCCVFSSKTSETVSVRAVKDDSDNVLRFMASNELKANPKKTVFMVIGSPSGSSKLVAKIGPHHIEQSQQIKHLGVTIQSNLRWNTQAAQPKTELNRQVGLFRRIFSWIPRHKLLPAVHGLILSKIRFSLPIFGRLNLDDNRSWPGYMQDIQVSLNTIKRLLMNKHRHDKVSCSELSQSTGIAGMNQICAVSLMTEMRRAAEQQLPISLLRNPKTHDSPTLRRDTSRLAVAPAPTLWGFDGHGAVTMWNRLLQAGDSADSTINRLACALPP